MNVLIVVASKHGGTRGIGEAIADELRAHEIGAEVRAAAAAPPVAGYDAVVLGSAVYMGRWLPEVRRFVDANRAALAGVPAWLFSSGPLGDPPVPAGDAKEVTELLSATGARGHRSFAGRLDPGELGLAERLVAKAVHAPPGDFREWGAVRGWARDIAAAVRGEVVTGTEDGR
jgi:menaquinone-dependent protoporphyrinogen oxidase